MMMMAKYISEEDLEKNLEDILEGVGVVRIDSRCPSCDGYLVVHKGCVYSILRKKKDETDEIKADSEELYNKIVKKMSDVMAKLSRKKKDEKKALDDDRKEDKLDKMVNSIQQLADVVTNKMDGKGEKKKEPQILVKSKGPPSWIGEDYERFAGEVSHWDAESKESDYNKYHDLKEVLKKKIDLEQTIEMIVSTTASEQNKTVKRIMVLLDEKYRKT